MRITTFLVAGTTAFFLFGCVQKAPSATPSPQETTQEKSTNTQNDGFEEVELEEIETNDANNKELGSLLVGNLIDYYSTVYKLRSVGIENISDKNAKLAVELRQSISNLIKDGADVNYRDEEGNTPLYITVINNDKQILKTLIDNGAELNTKSPEGLSMLSTAIKEGSLDSAHALLDQKADPDGLIDESQKPLYLATLKSVTDNSYTPLAVRLLELGATPNLKGEGSDNLLLTTIKYKNSTLALKLLEKGANHAFIDRDGISVVNWAIIMRTNSVARAIFEQDNTQIEAKNTLSPFMMATVTKNEEIYDYLKTKGVIVKEGDKEWAALRVVEKFQEDELEALLNGERQIPQTQIASSATASNMSNGDGIALTGMDFISITDNGNEILISTQDTIQKRFILEKPLRAVVDFSRFSGARNYVKTINSEYLQKVQVGRHDGFYRVVLHIKNGSNLSFREVDGGIKLLVK